MSKNRFQAKTLSEAFLKRCRLDPDKTAFSYKEDGEWQKFSFTEQFENSKNLSLGLMDVGIEAEDTIAILANTSLDWGCMDFAILGCKAITVPVYPTNTPEDVEYIFNHAEIKAVFIDSMQNLDKVLGIAKKCKNLQSIIVNFEVAKSKKSGSIKIYHKNELVSIGQNQKAADARKFEENLNSARPDDTLTICYTSGTTGLPKGVLIHHSNMISALDDCSKVIMQFTTEDEQLLSFLPMSHIFGRFESYVPYYFGWRQAFVDSLESILPCMKEVCPTIMFSVPRLYEKAYAKIMSMSAEGSPAKQKVFGWAVSTGQQWISEKREHGSATIATELQYQLAKKLVFNKIKAFFGGKLKFCVSGGAALTPDISDFMESAGVLVLQGYGLTETCAPISFNVPDTNNPKTVGKVLPEVLVKIADDGEILVKSAKNFICYYKNETATKEAIVDGWFHTGDIGFLSEDGFLQITDRKKDLIKTSGGKYVAPQKIENLTKVSTYIHQIVVFGEKKPYITAVITLDQELIIKYAKDNKILFSEYSELVKNAKIVELIESEIKSINSELARWETIKKFHIIAQEFTVENGGLTPSMKVKRKHLTGKYQEIFDGLYN